MARRARRSAPCDSQKASVAAAAAAAAARRWCYYTTQRRQRRLGKNPCVWSQRLTKEAAALLLSSAEECLVGFAFLGILVVVYPRPSPLLLLLLLVLLDAVLKFEQQRQSNRTCVPPQAAVLAFVIRRGACGDEVQRTPFTSARVFRRTDVYASGSYVLCLCLAGVASGGRNAALSAAEI